MSTTPPPTEYNLGLDLIESYCTKRAQTTAQQVHAFTRIPLRETQVTKLEERMIDNAMRAESDEEVTRLVSAVEDAFVQEIRYRTPRMWQFCRKVATLLAMRLFMEPKNTGRTLEWRVRMIRILSRRMFKTVMDAKDDEEVNRRLQTIDESVMAKYGG